MKKSDNLMGNNREKSNIESTVLVKITNLIMNQKKYFAFLRHK